MKFGVHVMGVSLKSLGQVTRTYEENGIESAWVPEHLVFPATMPPEYPYSESGLPPVVSETPAYDPWVLLASLAAVTSTIRLATNIYILPLRHPLQTARSVVTLDRVSGGRVTLGMGVGWLSDEYDYLGIDFPSRGRRADATIEALRRLWADDVIEIHNEHFSFGPVVFQPKPLQKPSIPIEVGGAAPAALRRAGALGDGWIEIGCNSLDDFKAKLAVVMEARRRAGREEEPFEVTTSGGLGGPGLDGYRRVRDAGATRLLVGPPRDGATGRLTPESCTAWAERFRAEVIDKLD